MIIRTLLLTCLFNMFTLHSLEESEELEAELLEAPQEFFLNEEDELSLLPKKGPRPQVIITPTKASIPQ